MADATPDGLDRRLVLGAAGGAILISPAAAAPVPDIVKLDATALCTAIASRKLSCSEVMGAYLDHIAAFNPKVNAIVALQDHSDLMAQARTRDEQVRRGEIMGPLHGFPHAPKDLQPVKGIRSTSGSPILKDFVPARDSLAYAGVAGVADWLLGTDYGFLRAKPANVSLLSLLSPWPWYIPELVLIGAASAVIYYLPFAVADWVTGQRRAGNT